MSSNRNDLEIFFPRAQLTTRGVEHARRTRRRRKKNSPQRTRRGREGIHRGGHGEEGLTANDESAPQRARRRREKIHRRGRRGRRGERRSEKGRTKRFMALESSSFSTRSSVAPVMSSATAPRTLPRFASESAGYGDVFSSHCMRILTSSSRMRKTTMM